MYGGSMALTKDKLITYLETQLGMGRQESRQVVERLLKIMKDTLSEGEDLLISGFGKFSVHQKRARRGRNPQTKEEITLAARKVLVFKASGVLRKRINSKSDKLTGVAG
jgi:integration host factor subunit alpha